MTRDFRLVRAVLASSLIGRTLAALDRRVQSAWQTSSTRRTAQSFRGRMRSQPAAVLLRTFAAAIAIAAMVQLLLMNVLPRTVAPAMPWMVLVLVALFAVAIARLADPIVSAWPASRLARRLFSPHRPTSDVR